MNKKNIVVITAVSGVILLSVLLTLLIAKPNSNQAKNVNQQPETIYVTPAKEYKVGYCDAHDCNQPALSLSNTLQLCVDHCVEVIEFAIELV